ncbi:serine/threonine-protein phosphatase 7 long form homolog [Arachis duranensis]|uniref:Serine/threonine-protein phosphatase 7 long form homolog n=1 Tax=Arachis duranensis TaxID=130453 RepID=A0A9C6TGQ3_ARADU|nr:serine/threonine-protein phosphatase 7 long form homolog [Arachis duranensis]
MTDKSNNLIHIRWLPLLGDPPQCDGCILLLISWIYHRFPQWEPSDRDVATFPLAARLVSLGQQSRDHHEGRLLRWRHRLDTVSFDQFRWTPYDRPELQALCPDWLRSGHEIHTWRAVVPLVCFNFVEFHHVDRVKRQLGSDQQIPEDPLRHEGMMYGGLRCFESGMIDGELVISHVT